MTATDDRAFSWQARRCLVTGARGFLGDALCRALARHGAETHGSGRGTPPNDFVGRWHECDVADETRIRELTAEIRPDTVFHMAATVSGSRDIGLVLPMLTGIVAGTVHVLLAAHENRCRRVVCLGSLQEPDDRLHAPPPTPYAAAKYSAGAYARMFSEVYALPVSIARPFMAYGAGQLDLTKLVPHTLSKLLRGGTAELSSGRQPFDWVYVDAVVDALLATASADKAIGKTVDIGCGVLTPVRDVAIGLAQRVGRPEALRFGAIPDRTLEPTRSADLETTAAVTGWRPKIGLEQGLDLAVDWYRRHFA